MDVLFLDANVLFAAAYRPDAGIGRLWEVKDARLVTSAYAVEEARRNLPRAEQQAALERLVAKMDVAAMEPAVPADLPDVSLPEKDRPILAAAIQAKATHLLTGDFRHFGPLYEQTIAGVLIRSPVDYLLDR